MASKRKGFEDQKVLSQLVACLVSMGYQVNQCIMDSWNYGSCQRRSRIILTIAAPGLETIRQQPHTHSRSYEETKGQSLGKLPNGEHFGDREHYATPFPYVSAQEATEDLPDIGNGNVQTCVQFPDHRLSRPSSVRDRKLLECIPVNPPGSGYNQAVQLGLVPHVLRTEKKETAKSYQRIKADDLIPTITTAICIQDSRNGAAVHWREPRPLSILEARRTQGIPDEEPIIGTLSQQWMTIGNGVDRMVSFPIGLALRNAFSRSRRTSSTSRALQVEAEVEMIVDAEGESIPRLSTETENTTTDSLRNTSPSSSASSSTNSSISVRGGQPDQPAPTTKRSREDARGPGDAPTKRAKTIDERRTTFPATSTRRDHTRGVRGWASAPPLEVPIRTRGSGPAEYAPKAWNMKIGTEGNIVRLP